MKIFLCLGLFSVFFLHVSSVELDDVKEGDCIVPDLDKNFDLNWAVTGASEWYHVIWGRYHLYRTVASLMDITESRVSKDEAERSCPVFTWSGNTAGIFTGFGKNRKMTIDLKATPEGILEYTQRPANLPGKRGKYYVTLSDNKSYYVKVSCWAEGQKSYAVASTKKSLDADTLATIKDHIKGLGFKEDNLVDLSYDNCITLPPNSPPATAAPSPPGGDSSTGNSNPTTSGPLSGFLSILRTKIDFLRGLIMTVLRFLTAPIRFITQALGNLRFGRGGADRG